MPTQGQTTRERTGRRSWRSECSSRSTPERSPRPGGAVAGAHQDPHQEQGGVEGPERQRQRGRRSGGAREGPCRSRAPPMPPPRERWPARETDRGGPHRHHRPVVARGPRVFPGGGRTAGRGVPGPAARRAPPRSPPTRPTRRTPTPSTVGHRSPTRTRRTTGPRGRRGRVGRFGRYARASPHRRTGERPTIGLGDTTHRRSTSTGSGRYIALHEGSGRRLRAVRPRRGGHRVGGRRRHAGTGRPGQRHRGVGTVAHQPVGPAIRERSLHPVRVLGGRRGRVGSFPFRRRSSSRPSGTGPSDRSTAPQNCSPRCGGACPSAA